jgi:hypothetical protein
MIGARGEPFPQAISASKASVDLRNRRWDRADGCRKDPLEAGIVNPFEVLSQNRGGRLAGSQDRSAKSALVRRKNSNSALPPNRRASLSISRAILSTANRSALSSVTAYRRTARCQARSVLAYHSNP